MEDVLVLSTDAVEQYMDKDIIASIANKLRLQYTELEYIGQDILALLGQYTNTLSYIGEVLEYCSVCYGITVPADTLLNLTLTEVGKYVYTFLFVEPLIGWFRGFIDNLEVSNPDEFASVVRYRKTQRILLRTIGNMVLNIDKLAALDKYIDNMDYYRQVKDKYNMIYIVMQSSDISTFLENYCVPLCAKYPEEVF